MSMRTKATEAALPERGFKAAFPLLGAGVGLAILLVMIALVGGAMMMMKA